MQASRPKQSRDSGEIASQSLAMTTHILRELNSPAGPSPKWGGVNDSLSFGEGAGVRSLRVFPSLHGIDVERGNARKAPSRRSTLTAASATKQLDIALNLRIIDICRYLRFSRYAATSPPAPSPKGEGERAARVPASPSPFGEGERGGEVRNMSYLIPNFFWRWCLTCSVSRGRQTG